MKIQIEVCEVFVGSDRISASANVSIRQEINEAIDRACEKFHVSRDEVRVVIGSERHSWFS